MWITDEKGNRCSVERWGSEEKARDVLETNKDCSGCSDCYGCSGCYDCSGCSDCSDCYGCSGCYDCSRCSRCSDCSGCSRCSDCSGCSGLYNTAPAVNRLPVPSISDLHKILYAAVTEAPESLDMSDVHGCATTHCRAGWVVTLAGKEGKALESKFGWELAAMKIYDASCPGYKINPCRFYDSNNDAMEDMRKLAEAE